jgi:hypothetical protein
VVSLVDELRGHERQAAEGLEQWKTHDESAAPRRLVGGDRPRPAADLLWAAYCLHFAYYNFCRIHQTLRVTPAMEAGITAKVWTLRDLLAS